MILHDMIISDHVMNPTIVKLTHYATLMALKPSPNAPNQQFYNDIRGIIRELKQILLKR